MLKLREKDNRELDTKDNFLQSSLWAELKGAFGWKPFSFDLDGKSLLVLVRNLAGPLSLAYIPHGPEIPEETEREGYCELLGKALKEHLPRGCFMIRFDFPDGVFQTEPAVFSYRSPLVKSISDIQPPDTVILSLDGSEEEILAGMKSKTRYNVRLAGKKGVAVSLAGSESLHDWYSLYKETAERDRISIHSEEYYGRVFGLTEQNKKGNTEIVMFRADYNGLMLAGIIVLIYGRRATYLYGASSNDHRNLMPSYALQWEAIKYAKKRGCSEYDFFGIPPENDPAHPMSGLYRFKTGFGGGILHRPGCWDLPLNKGIYYLYRIAEKLRIFYHKVLKKR